MVPLKPQNERGQVGAAFSHINGRARVKLYGKYGVHVPQPAPLVKVNGLQSITFTFSVAHMPSFPDHCSAPQNSAPTLNLTTICQSGEALR